MAYVTIQSTLEEAGLVTRQVGEVPAGVADGTNKGVTVSHKPLADNNYNDVLDTGDVVAYVNGAVVAVDSVAETSGLVTLASAPAEGAEVTIDYSYAPFAASVAVEVIEEATDWIDQELVEVVEMPDPIPATIRKIARVYAAGLLMIRYYMHQRNDEAVSAGEAKLKMAEGWMASYRARLVENGDDVGDLSLPSTTDGVRLFQRYDPLTGTWGPLSDENFRVNGAP